MQHLIDSNIACLPGVGNRSAYNIRALQVVYDDLELYGILKRSSYEGRGVRIPRSHKCAWPQAYKQISSTVTSIENVIRQLAGGDALYIEVKEWNWDGLPHHSLENMADGCYDATPLPPDVDHRSLSTIYREEDVEWTQPLSST